MSDHTDVDDGYDTDPDPTAGPTQYLQPGPHENHHHQLASDGSSDKPHSLHRIQPTPVPYRAVLALAASRVMEGIIWSSILPYINAFIRDIGVPKHQVGVWSAASESALNACEALSAPFYVAPANRFGRRPVLLVCIAGFGIFAAGFGLVKDLVGIIAMRGALGTMAGAGMVSRTMLGEVCDGTNRVKCFSIFSPALIVGTTIGPVIGGFLAKPVPRLLDPTWKLFVEFPYLLPALVCGLCGLISFLFGLAFIPETLPPSLRRLKRRQRNQRRHSRAHSTSTSISAGPARAARKTSERDALLTPDRAARVSRYGTSSSTSPNTNNSAVYGDEDEDESSEMSDVGSVLTAHSRLSTPAISRTRSKSNANNASKARRCSRTSTTTGTAGGDRHRRPSEALSIGSKLSIVSDVSEDAQANVSLWRLMKHGPYRRNLILFALSSGLMLSFEAILPLFAYTAPDLGGLGLSVETIGKILAVSAIVSVGMTLFVHPYLHRVMPERWYLFMCLSAWPIAILAFPLLWLTAHGFSQGPTPPPQGHDNALSAGIVFWLCVHIVARRIGDLGVTLLDTNIIANVPSPAYNALANSAAFTAASTSAGLTPLVLSYMFSLSTLSPSHSIGRQAVWIVFALGNLPGLYGAWTAY